jgi:MoxR-like ATPase
MKLNYVANQMTPEGLDEVQRLTLAWTLGQHAALSGPPGVGKTELVEELPKIVHRELHDITCTELMTESPLIGWPELVGNNGSSVNKWVNGVSTAAAEGNGILYLDEFDRLDGSVQKRHNSLFDNRRNVRRRDGTMVQAGDDFIAVVSYNPSDRAAARELEEAVADRFVHMKFDYLPPELEAAVALHEVNSLPVVQRGILLKGKDVRFLRQDGDWKDYFTGEKVTHTDGMVTYNALEKSIAPVDPPTLARSDLARKTAEFFTSVRSLSEHGTNKLPAEIKTYLSAIGEFSQQPLHKPSTRIIQASIAQYDALVKLGMQAEKAQSHATHLCIDQITYGKFGTRRLKEITLYDAVTQIAEYHDLLGQPVRATGFTP